MVFFDKWLWLGGVFSLLFLYVLVKKLTPAGVLTALIMGWVFWLGTGAAGLLLVGSFFVLGVLATAYGRRWKEQAGYTEPNHGKRTAGQVLANGGVALLLALIAYLQPAQKELAVFLVACAASAATADTLSSELGVLWGKRTFNILTFRKDHRGENGVISLEGIMAGLAGSVCIAALHYFLTGSKGYTWLIVVLAGLIGNLVDSILGATIERKGLIGNNAVNFLNTLAAAITGLLLHFGLT